MSKDTLQRFLFEHAPIRGEYVHLHTSFQTIMDQHQYPQLIRHILGQALCVATLLSAIIKFEGRVTVQFRGSRRLKMLLAQCDNEYRIRGLAKWSGEAAFTEDTLLADLKQGTLAIMLDAGGDNRYQGLVAWQGQSLAESIEGYFNDSEQLVTKIILKVNDENAYGFLLQVTPGNDKQSSGTDEARALPEWQRVANTPVTLTQFEQYPIKSLLTTVYPDDVIRLFPEQDVKFHCSCSRERSENALLLMGEEEAEEELRNNKNIVVTCDFCSKEYVFDGAEVRVLFKAKQSPKDGSDHIH